MDQITLEDIKDAIKRAEEIRKNKINTDKILVGSTSYYSNPDFSLHEFIKTVLKDSGQL